MNTPAPIFSQPDQPDQLEQDDRKQKRYKLESPNCSHTPGRTSSSSLSVCRPAVTYCPPSPKHERHLRVLPLQIEVGVEVGIDAGRIRERARA